ncbi:hypothetical protein AB4Z10_13140 [Bosea sp. RAF48]|uniref:hypothetical protein n=1 Tax=Bosea sp. RAF48 TaxID=3237480 RepID=UPI003F8EF7E1
MIDFKEIKDGDAWEAFSRDYLVAMGLVVDIPPGRGPDGGRDLLIKEQLKGELISRTFTWLVSCKNYAGSGAAVGTEHETNIVDRLTQHSAEGFIGFYSTVASAALITRLKELREQRRIAEFEIFDASRIEAGFHNVGLSGVLAQHLPLTHTVLRPIHPLIGHYVPLECEVCKRDLLKTSMTRPRQGAILFAQHEDVVRSVHFVCKGECDQRTTRRLNQQKLVEGWDDIDDYFNPLIFFRRVTGYLNEMRKNPQRYSDAAHEKMIELYLAASQRTLRQMSEEDREQYLQAREVEELGV